MSANVSEHSILEWGVDICVELGLFNEDVCSGLVADEFGPIVLNILSSTVFDPWDLCSRLGVCNYTMLMPTKPPRSPPSCTKRHSPPPQPPPKNPARVLHLTDIHFDENYVPGSWADCVGAPICCNKESRNGTRKAGDWGEYQCDTTIKMLSSLAEHLIAMDPQPDFVVWTGDSPPHDIWRQTPEHNMRRTSFLIEWVHSVFPNVPVFPSMGNHETSPADQFTLRGGKYRWLTEGIAEAWSPWLPKEAQQSVASFGYYTTLVKPGLRVVALNSQYGDPINFYLFLDGADPGGQWAWLRRVLADARSANERVWLLAHIPPARFNSLPAWDTKLHEIIDEYNDVLAAIFTGHTHMDEWSVVRDVATDSKPLATIWIAPSVTPFLASGSANNPGMNPSFRIYNVDGDSGDVHDLTQFYANLSESNQLNKVTWRKEYSMRERFGLTGLTPAHIADLTAQLWEAPVFETYWPIRYALGHAAQCDPESKCQAKVLCQMGSATASLFTDMATRAPLAAIDPNTPPVSRLRGISKLKAPIEPAKPAAAKRGPLTTAAPGPQRASKRPATARPTTTPTARPKTPRAAGMVTASTRPATARPTTRPVPAKPPTAARSVGIRAGGPPNKRRKTPTERLEEMETLTSLLKGKVESADDNVIKMTQELQRSAARLTELETARAEAHAQLQAREIVLSETSESRQQLEKTVETLQVNHQRAIDEMTRSHGAKVEAMHLETVTRERERDIAQAELRATREECARQKVDLAMRDADIMGLKTLISQLEAKLKQATQESTERAHTIERLEVQLSEMRDAMADLESKAHRDESLRRRLHNTIQELKGNIRVYARVRPFLSQDGQLSKEGLPFSFPDDGDHNALVVEQQAASAKGDVMKTSRFQFDHVFGPEATQSECFEEISQLVQSALDGYNVCIFAYGQTGSGKTFTMEGGPTVESRGMIPRAVDQIFESAARLGEEQGWAFELKASYVEIYNETLRDLLVTTSEAESKVAFGVALRDQGKSAKKSLEIKHDARGTTTVTDLTVEQVKTPEQVMSFLQRAMRNRAVGATNANEHSSRSHSVFILTINGTNAGTGATACGVLNLVDLAGSERLEKSGSTGDRLKEAQAINKSLSSLGDVIAALAAKDRHVPFRNSKLTYLLQNSLGGNSKTLMFANISPTVESVGEGVSTLRFAVKVNSAMIGTAQKRVRG